MPLGAFVRVFLPKGILPKKRRKRRRTWRRNADIRFNILIALRGRINRIKLMFHGVHTLKTFASTCDRYILCTYVYVYIYTTIHLQDATSMFSPLMNYFWRGGEGEEGYSRGENTSAIREDFTTRFCYVFRRMKCVEIFFLEDFSQQPRILKHWTGNKLGLRYLLEIKYELGRGLRRFFEQKFHDNWSFLFLKIRENSGKEIAEMCYL